MGLTAWTGAVVRKGDVTVGKNYLREEEIAELNRIVTMFLVRLALHVLRNPPEPKPTPPPMPQETIPPDSPYRQRPGETVQEYLRRVPGPVKIVRVVPPDEPPPAKPHRHLRLVPALSRETPLPGKGSM